MWRLFKNSDALCCHYGDITGWLRGTLKYVVDGMRAALREWRPESPHMRLWSGGMCLFCGYCESELIKRTHMNPATHNTPFLMRGVWFHCTSGPKSL